MGEKVGISDHVTDSRRGRPKKPPGVIFPLARQRLKIVSGREFMEMVVKYEDFGNGCDDKTRGGTICGSLPGR